MRAIRGFSIIELLVVIAVLGVLLAIGFINLPRDRFAVNQVAEGLARNVQLARFEAIRQNTFVGIRVLPATNSYEFFRGRIYDGDAVFRTVRLGDTDTPGVTIAAVEPATDIVFDPRGIMIANLGVAGKTVRFEARTASRVVNISQQGRAELR